jgi:riboflavin biosynthesis pyrimidine reductase
MFKYIYNLGYRRVFFETGLTFLNSLLNTKLLNKLYIFQNNTMLKNIGSNNAPHKYLKKIKLKKKLN